MDLRMQGANGTPQNLPANDNSINTGSMGDCVSVVVLYNYQPAQNRYLNGRGWHGLGGVEVINMGAMMDGVPNLATTQVIIVAGSLHETPFAINQNLDYVKTRLTAHGNVNVRYVAGRSQATVNRQGLIT